MTDDATHRWNHMTESPGRHRLPARLRHRRALLLPPAAAPEVTRAAR